MIFGLLLASIAGLTGYFYARLRLKRREEELSLREAEMRRQRVDLQRLSYQESTSRIHQSSGTSDIKSREVLEALLDQLRRDYSILEQETQFEQRLYREDNQSLREELAELKGSPIEFRGALGEDLFEDAKEIEQLDEEGNDEASLEEQEVDPIPVVEESATLKSIESPESILDDQNLVSDSWDLKQPNFEEFEFHWTDEPDEMAEMEEMEEAAKESEDAEKPVQDTFPVFRAFSDFVPQNDNRRSDPSTPSFSSLDSLASPHVGSASRAGDRPDLGSGAREPSVTSLIGLSPDQFALLSDLGYASSEKRAQLSPEEISRLSEIFRIPADFIRSHWMKQNA